MKAGGGDRCARRVRLYRESSGRARVSPPSRATRKTPSASTILRTTRIFFNLIGFNLIGSLSRAQTRGSKACLRESSLPAPDPSE
jgi:hypothetical protein